MPVHLSTFLAALAFASVHLASPWLSALDRTPHSIWLSLAGGISTSYVFVHLLPELARLEVGPESVGSGSFGPIIFATALAGLVAFYGIERMAREGDRGRDTRRSSGAGVYALQLGSFAVYNAVICYLLEEQALEGSLALYALAMAMHFVVNDRALGAHHGPRYERSGRFILSGAALAVWAAAQVIALPHGLVSGMLAFLAGGVVLNIIKEELPQERESRFWAFALGAGAYAALLTSS